LTQSIGFQLLRDRLPVVVAELLRVGVARDFPPYMFVDDAGEPRGFAVDVFRAAAKLQGLAYEFVPGTAPIGRIIRFSRTTMRADGRDAPRRMQSD
jgi:hypothetical protein